MSVSLVNRAIDTFKARNVGKTGDTPGQLPGPAELKFIKLIGERDIAGDLNGAFQNRRFAAREDWKTVSRALEIATQGMSQGEAARYINLSPEAQARLAKARDEVERLDKLCEEHGALSAPLAAVVQNCERWLLYNTSSIIVMHAGPEPQLRKGETLADAVERCRRRVRELEADRLGAERAPILASEAKAVVRRQIEAIAERARPDASFVVDGGGRVIFPGVRYGTDGVQVDEVGANLLAWLFKDQLIARLNVEIDEFADDKAALSSEVRAAKLDEIARDRLAVEREEEAFIMQAAATNQAIARRGDADPRAVLGVTVRA